jgi:hypothetical protein
VAERANDEILQLAGQGNLQALSVYLNRHLIPSGAHVKVKQKDEALHVLIVVMSESENAGLITAVQDLLLKLHPAHVKRVKIYTQILGQKQASLKQQFAMPPIAMPPIAEPQVTRTPDSLHLSNSVQAKAQNLQPFSLVAPPSGAKETYPKSANAFLNPSIPKKSTSASKPRRYSVIEFITQTSNIEDLRVLHDHPFFTGICPHCQHSFPQSSSPPAYWDCSKCGWKDDLSSVIPLKTIHNGSHQISLTEIKRLGDYLIEAGLLTTSQVEVALADQVTTQLRFGDVLIRRGWIKEETIEYLMQKVILPERTGHQNEASYLESSRNLLKTLLRARPDEQESDSQLVPAPVTSLEDLAHSKEPIQANDGGTSDKTDSVPKPKAMPFLSGKLANERETLILPDVELDELDNYLNGSQNKKKL